MKALTSQRVDMFFCGKQRFKGLVLTSYIFAAASERSTRCLNSSPKGRVANLTIVNYDEVKDQTEENFLRTAMDLTDCCRA